MVGSGLRILAIVAVSAGAAAGYVSYRGLPWVPDTQAIEARQSRHEQLRATVGITLEELTTLIEQCGAVVIDARPAEPYEESHLSVPCDPPVLNLQAETLDQNLDRVMELQGFPLVLYCTSLTCDLAEDLYIELENWGFADMRIYFPGWEGLEKSGLATESGPDMWHRDVDPGEMDGDEVPAEPNDPNSEKP